jgi:two-component system response regulator FixJ
MTTSPPIVYIVDDDEPTRRLLQTVLAKAKLLTELLQSATAFLETYDPAQPGCLLLDVNMPGMSGPELQHRLNLLGAMIPVIFVTGHADVPTAVHAMSRGAFDFLEKPIDHAALVELVHKALQRDAQNRTVVRDREVILHRFRGLTDRERDVLGLMLSGRSNKEMAANLHISQRTVENFRARIMGKTQAASLAQLIRMALDTGYGERMRGNTSH